MALVVLLSLLNRVCMKKLLTQCLAACILLLMAGVGFCQPPQRPAITGIAFVTLQVSDLHKAGTFYQSLLGYQPLPAKADPQRGTQSIFINARQSVIIKAGLPAYRDERLLSVAFQTADAEALRLYLEARGVGVPQKLDTSLPGILSFTVADPDGHAIQFVQRLANAKVQPVNAAPATALSRRILHAGLTISSAVAANRFYADILGFSEIWRGGATDSVVSWLNMRVPEGTDYLEYMLVSGPVSRQQLGSLHHIALMVLDMQQAVDMLGTRSLENGYPVAAPRIGRNNRWQLNLFDPDGTRIELMEPFTMR